MRNISLGSGVLSVVTAERSRPATPIITLTGEDTDREQAIETLCLSVGAAIVDSTTALDPSLTTPLPIAGSFKTDLLPRLESSGSDSTTPSSSDPVMLAMEVLGARLRTQKQKSRTHCDLCGARSAILYGRPGLQVQSVRYGERSYPRLADDTSKWIAYCPECRNDLERMRYRRLNPPAVAPIPHPRSRRLRR